VSGPKELSLERGRVIPVGDRQRGVSCLDAVRE